MFCLDNTIGSLDSSSQLDANLSGLIVFNGADRIDRYGTIDRISINFCKAPISSTAVIKLYVIKAKPNNPTQFYAYQHRTPISELKQSAGVQTFKDQNIPVARGDYLGFHFAKDAGSPFTINRDSYFTKLPSSSDSSWNVVYVQVTKREELPFSHCVSQGITVNFRIKDTRSLSEKITDIFRRPNTVNSEAADGPNTQSTEKLHQTENFHYRKSLSFIFIY